MPKTKKKLNELSQIHGKLEPELDNPTQEYEVTTLDQLFGDNGFSKYSTMDLEEYRAQITDYNTAELRTHAIEVAHVVPSISRERTEKRLLLEFQKHVAGFKTPKITHKVDKKPSKEALRIMAECK